MPGLRRAGIPVRWTDLVVRHTGYTDLALRAKKLDRDMRILSEELKDRPDEPFILFNLGAIAVERRDWRGSLDYLGRSLARSAPSDSITRKLYALIARAHQMLGDTAASLRTCAEGLSVDDQDAELLFRKAVVHRQRGESSEAEQCWRRILIAPAPRSVLQPRPGDLRPPHPAQPGRAGSGARGSRGSRPPLAGGARPMPRRPRGESQAGATRSAPVIPAQEFVPKARDRGLKSPLGTDSDSASCQKTSADLLRLPSVRYTPADGPTPPSRSLSYPRGG